MKSQITTSIYRAYSVFEEFRSIKNAKIFWIPLRAERIRVAPYHILIENMASLDAVGSSIAKGYCDEFFALAELNLFRDYMHERIKIEVMAKEYPIPIKCTDDAGNPLFPFRCLNLDKPEGVFNIRQGEIPSLPFDIAGFL